MAVFFVSDLHIGHKYVAMLRYNDVHGTSYGRDDLDKVADMVLAWHDEMLAANWDKVVGPDDVVWVLGDLAVGNPAKVLQWIDDRPGRKHLVSGNHDECHPMHRTAPKYLAQYLMVFDSVQPFARKRIAGKSVLLSHFPYQGDGEGRDRDIEERFSQYRLPDLGDWLIHGHVHHPDQIGGKNQKSIHIGVDAHDYTPVHIDRVAELMSMSKDKVA